MILLDKELPILQTRENMTAWLRHFRVPYLDPDSTLPDRCFFPYLDAMWIRLAELRDRKRYDNERWFQHHGTSAFWSGREALDFGSVQHIAHRGPGGMEAAVSAGADMGEFVGAMIAAKARLEADADRGNPLGGLAGKLVHAAEVVWPGKTNPFAIAEAFRKRGIEVVDVRKERV